MRGFEYFKDVQCEDCIWSYQCGDGWVYECDDRFPYDDTDDASEEIVDSVIEERRGAHRKEWFEYWEGWSEYMEVDDWEDVESGDFNGQCGEII